MLLALSVIANGMNQIMTNIQLTKFLKNILMVAQSLHHMVAQLIAKRLVSLTI